MKKENKVLICSVLNLLVERDPEWRSVGMAHKFKVLYDGWRQQELRAKTHSGYFYTLSWRRGWLPIADFNRFRAYAMQ